MGVSRRCKSCAFVSSPLRQNYLLALCYTVPSLLACLDHSLWLPTSPHVLMLATSRLMPAALPSFAMPL